MGLLTVVGIPKVYKPSDPIITMTQLIAACFIILLAVVAAQSLPEYVEGVPEARSRVARAAEEEEGATTQAPAEEKQCEAGKAGGLCADCSKLLMCDGKSTEPLAEIVCSEGAPESPYCVKNACAAEPDPEDESCKKASDVPCTYEGYVPDPKNCTKYYYCDSAGGDATPFNCPPNYVYNHESTMCKLKSSEKDCATMPCQPGKMFVVYPPDQSVYALCDPKTNKSTVFRCEDEKNEWFIEKTLSCGMICRKQGPFVDRRDCKKYHVCYVVNGKWKLENPECPGELEFDPEELKCMKKKEGEEECQPEIGGAAGNETATSTTTAASTA